MLKLTENAIQIISRNIAGRSVQRSCDGFTLMEAMLSSVILALAITSTLVVISQSSLYLQDLRMRARGSQILAGEVEMLRQQSWGQLTSFPTAFTDPNDTNSPYSGSSTLTSYQTYNGTTTVLRATLVLTWTNRHDRPVSITLTTLISHGGLNKT
jgi:Tfp pilus assembly protein PilV